MVMSIQPIESCYKAICDESNIKPYLIYLSPKGETLTQKKVVELSKMEHIVLLCGHYEGIDQRVIDTLVNEEISIGDFVLTGGELPALVLADSISRMLPGVLSDDLCFEEESHFSGLLEYPQYTRPAEWNGMEVPSVLLSGNHAEINKWRRKEALKITKERRPDMFSKLEFSKNDLKILKEIEESK